MKKRTASRNKKRSGTALTNTVIVLILLALMITGVILILIPYQETSEQEIVVKQEVQTFQELVAVYKTETIPATEPEEVIFPNHHEQLYRAMEQYNQDIFSNGQADLKDAWSYQAEIFDLESYNYSLDAVGLVKIPDIDVEMPLYLGASYDNLAKGFAQLSQTSMPIGGTNTNCVIAGHRGWKGMPYMRDVEMLEIGDTIYVENPWETLQYKISEIHLIEPWDVQCVYIKPNRDVLTVITCHPYGVGSHRYILICDRYYPEEEPPEIVSPTQGHWEWEWQTNVSISSSENIQYHSSKIDIFVAEYLPWLCVIAAFLVLDVFLITLISHCAGKKKKRTYGKWSKAYKARKKTIS